MGAVVLEFVILSPLFPSVIVFPLNVYPLGGGKEPPQPETAREKLNTVLDLKMLVPAAPKLAPVAPAASIMLPINVLPSRSIKKGAPEPPSPVTVFDVTVSLQVPTAMLGSGPPQHVPKYNKNAMPIRNA